MEPRESGELSSTKSQKRNSFLCTELLREQPSSNCVWLAFSPLKKTPMEFLVEKSTELGVARFIPLYIHYSDHKSYRGEKSQAHAIEAAQQSEQLHVPLFMPPLSLGQFLQDHPQDHPIYACLERTDQAPTLLDVLDVTKPKTILIGPEGGFSPAECLLLKKHPSIKVVTLGPSILRAETAAIVSLGCVLQKRESDVVETNP